MWFLLDSVKKRLAEANKHNITLDQGTLARYEAAGRDISVVAGSEVDIKIEGVLTPKPDFFAIFFGFANTAYIDIIEALAKAQQDHTIKKINLIINSPGGHIDGLFDAMAAIQAVTKPVQAYVKDIAASAAYMLASQADTIVALNPAVRVGSVGVVVSARLDEAIVDITSTEAPNKRPDLATDEGKAVLREELDALHDVFIEATAKGRKTTVKTVNSEFGRGAMIIASEALKRGMIDKVAKLTVKSTTKTKAQEDEVIIVNLETLKAQHPDVYAAAMQDGAEQERDRVMGHLILGESCGAMKIACEAIKDGKPMSNELQATYIKAGQNRNALNALQADSDDLSASTGAAPADNSVEQVGDQVAAAVEKQLGLA